MKISVIIPAYNAEKFLVESLQSVVNQTIDDFEIIVIDDGSTDSTLDILKNYEKSYENFNVICQENAGPAAARNKGLDVAKGEYIYFFDADDVLELDALESLYATAHRRKSDLVIAKYDIFNQFKHIEVKNINELVAKRKIDKYDLKILWTFSLWNKLFKKQIIDENNFRFKDLCYSEDAEFLMKYVYAAKRITGLDKVVLHYRRIAVTVQDEDSSITATLDSRKISDYITAHDLVLKHAEKSILKDFSEYGSLSAAMQENFEINLYINEIIKKELQILLNQFYSKFWNLSGTDTEMIINEINLKLKMLNLKSLSELQCAHFDLPLLNLPKNTDELLKTACFTAVLYGNSENIEDFVSCLSSLVLQNFVRFKIYLPADMKEYAKSGGFCQKNIFYIDAENEEELFKKSLASVDTEYIIFCNPKIVYYNSALRVVYKKYLYSKPDFVTELIYHGNFGEIQPVTLNNISIKSLSYGKKYNQNLQMDYTLANKFFKVRFLKEKLNPNQSILENLPDLYKKGYFLFDNDGIVVFNDSNDNFKDFISTDQSIDYINRYMEDKKVSLKSERLRVKSGESLVKLQYLKNNSLGNIIKNITIFIYKKRKLKNRTLFFSIRKDGELEGNAKALYPYVKGKKKICAKRLPHNFLYELKMIRNIMTSRVIVSDDYIRYIRHFAVKPEQKVIQLWHACGAFKKFGRRGTNISIATDLATHAQYNLVCVSGENVREVYADAFDIDLRKVSALGCPSTDKFFDTTVVENIKNKVYSEYPQFKDKEIIVYAPTFRDVGDDRTVFTPEINFDELSASLSDNQIFIVCPHPIMKNKIVDKEYKNIFVIRDFSTDDIMLISDMLITDYSSVIFEYSLLNKPIAFYCYDLATYNRDFYLKYPEDLPGEVLNNQQELFDFLKSDDRHKVSDKHKIFVEKYMSACDGNSGKRIANLINNYLGDK